MMCTREQLLAVVVVVVGLADLAVGQLTRADKAALLKLHNDRRRQVAKGQTTNKIGQFEPAAADMTKMIWDKRTAEAAQRWADTCPDGHEKQTEQGENLAWGWGQGNTFSWAELADLWYHEIDDVPGSLLGSPSRFTSRMMGGGIGHYTQMMWSTSYKLGCGARVCGTEKKKTLVCRYWFAGNFMDKPLYKQGPACSKCAAGQKCEDGLCVGKPFACKDKLDKRTCTYFKTQGYCAKGSQYQAYTQQNCVKSCGICK